MPAKQSAISGNRVSFMSAAVIGASILAGLLLPALPLLASNPQPFVHAVGYNSYGQVGPGSDTLLPSPLFLGNVKAVAPGSDFTLALKEDGTVWAWGYNSYGQLGDGTIVSRRTPVQVSGLTGVVAVAAASERGAALRIAGLSVPRGGRATEEFSHEQSGIVLNAEGGIRLPEYPGCGF